jgi:predicted nucleic acid-binding protein
VKRVHLERGTTALDSLLNAGDPASEFVTSDFALVECAGVLSRAATGVDRFEHSASVFRRLLKDLEGHHFQVRPVNPSVMRLAMNLAHRLAIRGADAVHVAFVADSATFRPDVVMVSADREILTACRELGIQTVDPTAAEAI